MFEVYERKLGSMASHFYVPPAHGRPSVSKPIIMTKDEIQKDIKISTARSEMSQRHRLPTVKKNYVPLMVVGGGILAFGILKGSKKRRK